MRCSNCVYYENDVCYRTGKKVSFNTNICEHFVIKYISRSRDGLNMDLIK